MNDIYTQYDDEGKRDFLSWEETEMLQKALKRSYIEPPVCGLCKDTVTDLEKDDFGRTLLWCGTCDVFFQFYYLIDTENNRLIRHCYPKDRRTEHIPMPAEAILVDVVESKKQPVEVAAEQSVNVWQRFSKNKGHSETAPADHAVSVRPPDKQYGYITKQILAILENSSGDVPTSHFIETIDADRPQIMNALGRLRRNKKIKQVKHGFYRKL